MAEKYQNTGIEEKLSFDVGMGPVPSEMPLPAGQEQSVSAGIKS